MSNDDTEKLPPIGKLVAAQSNTIEQQQQVIEALRTANKNTLRRLADVRAERDALKASARAWKQAAKRWRSDYNDLMADFTELTEAFEEADNEA